MINIVYRLKSPKFFEEAIDEIDLDGVIVRPTHLSICQADQRYYQGSRPAEVLEAKLVLSKKIVISINTEFIENETENVTKQDCETNAAKRLMKRLKREYPSIPICIQADNLYETTPMMRLCRENSFAYLLTHKEGH